MLYARCALPFKSAIQNPKSAIDKLPYALCAMPYALCALLIQSEIPNPKSTIEGPVNRISSFLDYHIPDGIRLFGIMFNRIEGDQNI